MDIAIIQPDLSNYSGGTKFVIECMLRWQKKNDVTIYTTTFDKKVLDENPLESEIKIIKPYINYQSFISLTFQTNKLSKQIGEHEIYNPQSFPANLIDKHPSVGYPHDGIRMVYDLKKPLLKRKDIPFYYKTAFRLVAPYIKYTSKKKNSLDHIISNSKYNQKYLECVYEQKVEYVVYPGINQEEYTNSRENTEKDKKLLISVSRLYPEKRTELAVKAMQYLPNYKLAIIGKGPDKTHLEKLIKELHLEKNVKIYGILKEKDLKDMYAKAFCTIFTPLREPFGIIALESLASGTPLIGVNEGGFTEIITDSEEGFLVPPDPKIIAEKIKLLEENNNLYENMVKKCIKTSKNYSWDRTANEILKIFKTTLKDQ